MTVDGEFIYQGVGVFSNGEKVVCDEADGDSY
ncbi:hypothetical protein BCEN4_350169 [Burkholderia cenocepacia]|nr:hypothetical protein BCEN4_350169 [Burkholderia cenocepacia]